MLSENQFIAHLQSLNPLFGSCLAKIKKQASGHNSASYSPHLLFTESLENTSDISWPTDLTLELSSDSPRASVVSVTLHASRDFPTHTVFSFDSATHAILEEFGARPNHTSLRSKFSTWSTKTESVTSEVDSLFSIEQILSSACTTPSPASSPRSSNTSISDKFLCSKASLRPLNLNVQIPQSEKSIYEDAPSNYDDKFPVSR